MTRMLVIITAALMTVWIPSEAAHLGDHRPAMQSAEAQSPHTVLLQNRFSGTALR